MGLNTNNVGEPSLLSYKLLKYIVSPPPQPPLLPHPTLYLQEFTNVLGSGDQKTYCCPFLGIFCFENQLLQSSQWMIKMLPVQCNAMRLVSKEENLKRQNYPKIHLTLLNSVQHPSTSQCHHPIFPLPLLCHLQ